MFYPYDGILTPIKSINPLIYNGPTRIYFSEFPKIGQSFLWKDSEGNGNTSEVKAIDSEKPNTFLLTTRNSLYKLEVK